VATKLSTEKGFQTQISCINNLMAQLNHQKNSLLNTLRVCVLQSLLVCGAIAISRTFTTQPFPYCNQCCQVDQRKSQNTAI